MEAGFMKWVFSVVLIALNLGALRVAQGEVSDVSVNVRAVEETATQADYVRIDPITASVPEGRALSLAQLAFQAQVSPGQLLELWVDDGGEGLPWSRNPVDRSLRKGLWVVDERTGNLVSFDITSLIRRAVSEERRMQGLYIRLIADDDGEPRSLRPTETPQARIRYHLHRE
jgi:hypothetical protein